MPLSEHEKRQLEQIEQAFRAGDPRFADAVHAADPQVHYKRRGGARVRDRRRVAARWGRDQCHPDRSGGLSVMLACSLWAVGSYRRMTGSAPRRVPAQVRRSGKKRHAAKGRRAGKQAGSGLMARLEERWRRRQERGRLCQAARYV